MRNPSERHPVLPLLAALLVAGCDGGSLTDPTGPSALRPSAAVGGAEPVDVSGDWVTSGEYVIHFAGDASLLFGVQPEGPRTHLRCEFTGTFSIVQVGATFGGSYAEDAHCETTGGQEIENDVEGSLEGTVRGGSVHFTLHELGEVPVACPQQGAIVEVAGGVAQRLQGSGRCLEPGHPKSTLGIPPPRLGPNRQLWAAMRP